MKKFLLILIFISFSSYAQNLKIKTLATINNLIITNIDLENEVEVIKILNINSKIKKEDIEKIALKNLIDQNLKKSEVINKKINIQEPNVISEYNKLLNEFKKNNIEPKEKIKELILEKLRLENKWNQIIMDKYFWQVNINMQEIEKKISDDKSTKNKELIVEIEKNKKLNVYSNNYLEGLRKKSLIKFYK